MTATSPGPVLIGGDGRSGTTLLSVVLDSHPDLAVGPELHFRGPTDLGRYVLDLLDVRAGTRDLAEWMEVRRDPERYAGVHFINRCHRFGVPPEELRGLVEQALRDGLAPLESFEQRAALVERIGRHVQRAQGARRWGIKIMRDLRVAQWYAGVWPDAIFVHVVRDGRDVAASQLREHTGWGYEDIAAAARGWASLVDRAAELAGELDVVEVRYEGLLSDPAGALAPLLDRLGVDWDDRMAQHERERHALFDNDYGHPSIEAVRRPMNASATGRYRRDLSAEQVAAFEQVAGAQLRRLGYPTAASAGGDR